MYDNIGEKIKSLAKSICFFEAAAAIIAGIALMVEDENITLTGLLVMVVGAIVAWASSWLLYGFGELIEKTCDNEFNTREIRKMMQNGGNIAPVTKIHTSSTPTRSASSAPVAADGWKCTCGRNHAAYESSCVCGVTKAEVKMKNTQNV